MPSGKQSLFSAERPEAFLRPEGYPARTVVATSRVLFAAMVLLSVAACSKVDGAWEEAMRTDTPDAYESFITKHPDSKQVELARTRRDALVDDRDWNVARRRATADAYSAYLEVHPEGVWSELAARRRAALPKQAPATAPATAADEPAGSIQAVDAHHATRRLLLRQGSTQFMGAFAAGLHRARRASASDRRHAARGLFVVPSAYRVREQRRRRAGLCRASQGRRRVHQVRDFTTAVIAAEASRARSAAPRRPPVTARIRVLKNCRRHAAK